MRCLTISPTTTRPRPLLRRHPRHQPPQLWRRGHRLWLRPLLLRHRRRPHLNPRFRPANAGCIEWPGLTDPSGLGAAVGWLSSASRKDGHAAFMVLARSLEEGEQVATVTSCCFRGAAGAIALTDRRLLVVNAREWEPDILPVGMEPGLTVTGWQDEKRAALVFMRDGHELVVDQILDRSMAQEIATAVRASAGG